MTCDIDAGNGIIFAWGKKKVQHCTLNKDYDLVGGKWTGLNLVGWAKL